MSNAYDSDNVKDNERRKFQEDSAGNTAVNVLSTDLSAKIDEAINKTPGSLLEGVSFDAIVASYPNTTTEVYDYKTGGASGTTVATVTVIYTTAAKDFIVSAVRT